MPYLFIFLFSLLVSAVLTFYLRKVGNRYNFFDIAPEDDVLKIHKKSISYLGGSAMMLTIFIGFILTVCLKQYLISEIMAVAAASLAIFSLANSARTTSDFPPPPQKFLW